MLKSKRIKNDIPWWHELKVGLVGTSLVAQWLRIRLPMQGTRVRALVWEDPTCRMTTKPACHNYWACPLEPMSHNYCSPRATTTEAHVPRAPAPQQEKPPQWEALAPQWRVAPAHHNYRKPACSNEDPRQPKKKSWSGYIHTRQNRLQSKKYHQGNWGPFINDKGINSLWEPNDPKYICT